MSMLMKKLSSGVAASLCAALMLSAALGPVDMASARATTTPASLARA